VYIYIQTGTLDDVDDSSKEFGTEDNVPKKKKKSTTKRKADDCEDDLLPIEKAAKKLKAAKKIEEYINIYCIYLYYFISFY